MRLFALLFVLLGGCISQYPQASYRLRMDVTVVTKEITVCNKGRLVHWRMGEDIIIFAYDSVYMELLPIKPNEVPEMNNELEKHESLYIKKNKDGVLYSVRIINRDGLLIWIVALDKVSPSYMLCFAPSCNC